MKIIKRNGEVTNFDSSKIKEAILKAMKYGSGLYVPEIADLIRRDAEEHYKESELPSVFNVEEFVYNRLVHYGQTLTAKAYEEYRAVQAFKRETNTTDESIISLVRNDNVEVADENSNKNAKLASTQRDLIAGEVSKDISRRKLIPAHIVAAHDTGVLHYHDMDYAISPIFNCCLVNIKDMLDNGTVINGKMVESPKGFQVACTVVTQIIAQISSGQYGGQSINVKHLGKYLARSRKKFENIVSGLGMDASQEEALVEILLQRELQAGVQTIQYQINTRTTRSTVKSCSIAA